MQYNILVLRNDFFFKKSMNLTKTDWEDNWLWCNSASVIFVVVGDDECVDMFFSVPTAAKVSALWYIKVVYI